MSRVQSLVYSIIQFLTDELRNGNLSGDGSESLEVAIQCLESAYGINREDPNTASRLQIPMSLLDMFTRVTSAAEPEKIPTPEEKAESEKHKNEGNNLMKTEKYQEALECYTKAIELDSHNAIFYCNRAAAYSKLNNNRAAIDDCRTALRIDPNYGKAYGRMGVAYASLNQFKEARESYKKATELDPGNESHINNLRIAEERLREASIGSGSNHARDGAAPGGGVPFGGLDFANLLNNPALMNMATQVMADPNMQQLMGNLMSSVAPGGSRESGNPDANPGINALLQAGQQLAQQMQAANPDLVEQLRRQMNPDGSGGPGSSSQ